MKTSKKPTQHILVRAETNSDWDSCDFAIITISDKWKEQQAKRLTALESIKDAMDFLNVSYRNAFVDFYKVKQLKLSEIPTPNLENLLGDTDWTFVELDEEEQEKFLTPESTLNCYKIVYERLGYIYYMAYGKHTGEEYYTANILLTDIIKED